MVIFKNPLGRKMLGMKIFLNLTERGVASTSIYVSN